MLDTLSHRRRNMQAALRFFRKALAATQDQPRVLIADKLGICPAAYSEIFPSVERPPAQGLE